MKDLAHLAALGRTATLGRKVHRARLLVEEWLRLCERPVISCGGGKDSTALLQLVHSVEPTVPVVCADPPNPLPDRPEHVRLLEMAAGGGWTHVPYPWDVDAVLDGREQYPEGLKIVRLRAELDRRSCDGYALGIRCSESKGRRLNYRKRGALYLTGGRLVCTPIATWSAEEVLGYVLAANRLPLNPVYRKWQLAPSNLDWLRDGTWYPREAADGRGYRAWLAYHYPELVGRYDRAVLCRPLDTRRRPRYSRCVGG